MRDISSASNNLVSFCPKCLHLICVGQVLNIETVPVLSLLVIIIDKIHKLILTGARIIYGNSWNGSCSNLTVNFAAIGWGSKSNTNTLCEAVAGRLVDWVKILLEITQLLCTGDARCSQSGCPSENTTLSPCGVNRLSLVGISLVSSNFSLINLTAGACRVNAGCTSLSNICCKPSVKVYPSIVQNTQLVG